MEKYKIEFADVRLTPEQLKATQDKIESLESTIEDYEFKLKRMILFLQKLEQVSNLDPISTDIIFKYDKDFDLMISNSFTASDKISISLRKKP